MSQKFRTISNAVSAGRKLNELAEKNKRNVTFYMDPDGVAHAFTLTDAERVSTSEIHFCCDLFLEVVN